MNDQQIDRKNHKPKQSDHSLGPDMYTGWQSKSLTPKLKQIPLIFAHTTTDFISKSLTSFGSQHPEKVVYMGFRPASNMKAFKQFGQNRNHKYVAQSFLYSKKTLKRFKFLHSQQSEKYFPIRPSEYRLFKGINPTWKNQDIKFNSQFQGGNLDLAIVVNPNEYDLLMRVDSNTKGHTCWYFFKVFDIKKRKKIRFNIINFTKGHLLYAEGMKPYVFRTSKMQWSQQGIDVQFKNKTIRYFTQNDEQKVVKCLSFTYEFQNINQEVYFAYSIPYSYSYLLEFLDELQKKHGQFIKVNYDNQSTGGIPLPVVTVTNFTKQTQKQKHLIIGRQHPGQAQGSWMMQGFMKYICSPDANYLRDKVEFKIIPMVNVDGVVLGNFRTGIGGRDLNRMFNKPNQFNETKLIKDIAQSFSPQIFIDFHGHSAKKNVFIYGPEYKLQDSDYLTSRIYPKIISKKTQAFRYYSCIFKISESKVNTGRALLFQQFKTRFVFTVQASTHAFGQGKQTVLFNKQKYVEVGEKIAQSLQQFVKILIKVPRRLSSNLLQSISSKSLSIKNSKQIKNRQQIEQLIMSESINIDNYFDGIENDIEKELLMQILENEKQMAKNANKNKKIMNPQSDSDCQNQNQDYTQKQLNRLQKTISMNKNDSIQKILSRSKQRNKDSPLKNSKKLNDRKRTRNFNTVQVIPGNNELNKSLLLKKELNHSKELSIDRNKYHSFFDQLTYESQSKIKLGYKKEQQAYSGLHSKIHNQEVQQNEKLRRLDAWKSTQFRKYNQVEPINLLLRNKSANQVYLQGPPEIQIQPLHKLVPKMRSQNKKKQLMLMIKRSFLPTVIKQAQKPQSQQLEMLDNVQNRGNSRSLINQILELHQKKKKKNPQSKINKKYKIAFYEG